MEELAQILVLLLIVSLSLAVIKNGPGGAKQWWRAKFLGRQPGEA